MRSKECGNCIAESPKTSTADDAMLNARDVASLLTRRPFGNVSIATTYWTLWTDTISGILLFSEIQTAGTSKRVSVTSVSRNLLNGGNSLAVHFLRNYCQSNCQRVILMSQMKRVMIGGSSFGRTPTI